MLRSPGAILIATERGGPDCCVTRRIFARSIRPAEGARAGQNRPCGYVAPRFAPGSGWRTGPEGGFSPRGRDRTIGTQNALRTAGWTPAAGAGEPACAGFLT